MKNFIKNRGGNLLLIIAVISTIVCTLVFGGDNPPKFWFGGSHFGKVMKEKLEVELNKNK